jgi:carboxymethylenebutenolidase
VVGFCMGGAFVLTLAAQQGDRVAAAVPFYPVGPLPDDYRGLTAAVLAHFGEDDAFVPVTQADELAAKIRAECPADVTVHTYPAGHAFNNDDNLLGTYDPEQAGLAWDRTVSFLRERLA